MLVRRSAVLLAVLGLAATPALVGSAAAGASASTGRRVAAGRVLARLDVLRPAVEVRREGSKKFLPGHDGQRLHRGDTIRTNAQGQAEIDYTDDSFTRLDVSTTFTIKHLTDKQGDRRVEGSVDLGRTWNRTSALTESESFKMDGAGATASVVGTAFVVDCSTAQQCQFLAVVHVTNVTGANGGQDLGPGVAIGALDGNLGTRITLTLQQLVGDDWVQANLYLDELKGIGPGPFIAATTPHATTTHATTTHATTTHATTTTGGSSTGVTPPTSGGSTTGVTPPTSGGQKPGCGKGDQGHTHTGTPPGCQH
jgi:hypothetical protein